MNEVISRTLTGILILIGFGGAYLHSSHLFIFALVSILGIILVTEWPRLMPQEVNSWWLITIAYPVLPFGLLMGLTYVYRGSDFYLPIYPVLAAWTSDTAGYILGKLFGKTKITPILSPKKTWEGFFGGIVAVFCMHIHFLPKILVIKTIYAASPLLTNVVLSCLFTTTSFLGGLFLSFLKRKNNLKDAGSILPGHGGFLDRFDSVMATALLTSILVATQKILQ